MAAGGQSQGSSLGLTAHFRDHTAVVRGDPQVTALQDRSMKWSIAAIPNKILEASSQVRVLIFHLKWEKYGVLRTHHSLKYNPLQDTSPQPSCDNQKVL